MWFHIRAIKESYDTKHNLDAIIFFDNEGQLHDFLHKRHILSISQEPYTADSETFGDIYGSIQGENTKHDFVIRDMDIATSIYTLLFMGLDIQAINSYSQPLDPSDAVASIKNITQHVSQEQYKQTEKTTKHTIRTGDGTENTISTLQTHVTTVLQDADYALSVYPIIPTQTKNLQDLIGTLKKMRLSNNIEKLQEVIYRIYRTIDSLEEFYLSQFPQDYIDSQSSITLPTFISYYDRRQRIKQLHHVGITLPRYKKIYAHTGGIGLILYFLYQDIMAAISARFSDAGKVTHTLMNILIYSIIALMIVFVPLSISNNNAVEYMSGYGLLLLGLMGISLSIGYILSYHKRWISTIIILISVTIFVCLYYMSRWILILYT